MSITNGQPAWQPPYLHHTNSNRSVSHLDDVPARTQTPIDNPSVLMPEAPLDIEEENRRALFADLYRKTEDKVALLFSEDGSYNYPAISALRRSPPPSANIIPPTTDHEPIKEPPLKKAKRTIEEDDFDDDGSDDGILLMAKSKKKSVPSSSGVPRPPAFNPRRRDTNISIASTETAKKVPTSVHGDEWMCHYES